MTTYRNSFMCRGFVARCKLKNMEEIKLQIAKKAQQYTIYKMDDSLLKYFLNKTPHLLYNT